MAELMLADNSHTSVVLRAIGVQDGRPYDNKYAFPNRFTLVGCLTSTVSTHSLVLHYVFLCTACAAGCMPYIDFVSSWARSLTPS